MATIRIPTPLRPYTGGQASVSVGGDTVGAALHDLVTQYPDLSTHLFADGKLRSFVNVFLGEEDVRFLDGLDTFINAESALRIIPTIAGGTDAPGGTPKVDQTGLKTGQATTILVLILAFVLNAPLLVALVAVAQLLAALEFEYAPYKLLYLYVVRGRIAQPKVITDNPEPHRFASLVGALFNGMGTLALLAGAPLFGWLLVGVVVVLANLNFWVNFCLGCWMYYQFNRLGVPGFTVAPVE